MPSNPGGIRFTQELAAFLVSRPTRAQWLAFRPSDDTQARARELLQKQNEGLLSPEERQELDAFAHAERLLRLVKARLSRPGFDTAMSERLPAKLRARVRQRAGKRCEYCLLHEDDAGLAHEPDHVLACRHGGLTTEDNLAWACHLCNNLKAGYLSSIDLDTGRVVRLFHPRTDRWNKHFRLQGARIVPLTAMGRATEYLLQFNHPENVEMRQALIAAGRYPR